MSLVLLTQCLKAVPGAAFQACLDYINDEAAGRPGQEQLTTFSHSCQTPSLSISYEYWLETLELDGWSFADFIPDVQAELEAARYFHQATSTAWQVNQAIDDYCGVYTDDSLNMAYTWYKKLSGTAGVATYGTDAYLLYSYTSWTDGYMRWEGGASDGNCVSADADPYTSDDDEELISMNAVTHSSTVGEETATATTRACWSSKNGGLAYFDVTLSDEMTEADVLDELSEPSWSSTGSTTISGVPKLYNTDGTFELRDFGLSRGSIRQVRAGAADSFLYGQFRFTSIASGLIPGAQYKATFLLAKREAINQSGSSWYGDWELYNTLEYTFTATGHSEDVIATPYTLPTVQGYEIRLISGLIERL